MPWSRGLGENLAYTTWDKDGALEWILDAIRMWDDEKKYHRSGDGWGCFTRGNCLHYTGILWKSVTRVGCAVRNDCGRKKVQTVCHYTPQPNMRAMGGRGPKDGELPR